MPSIEQKLARFAQNHPENALANYYYALALWKRDRGSENPDALRQVESWLLKSLAIDPARLVAAAQIDLTRRAETIPVGGFVAMARELTHIRNAT